MPGRENFSEPMLFARPPSDGGGSDSVARPTRDWICDGLHHVIEQIDEIGTIPVWQVVNPPPGTYPGKFVRFEDLPPGLEQAFRRWQYSAAMPFSAASYDYDFASFVRAMSQRQGGNGP